MDISKIVYGPKFDLEVPQGELSDEGQYEVMALLEGHADITAAAFRAALPADWSWEWKVAHGTYAGTLSKRIQSLVFKAFAGKKLSETLVTALGNTAKQHTLEGRSFRFDFDNQLAWDAGDFGDDGSCFWTEKGYILPTLAHFGGQAIRLYQTDAGGRERGVGRALLLPYVKGATGFDPESWTHPDAMLVFNGYGKDMDNYGKSKVSSQRYGNMQVLDYARLLALFLGVSYQRARMRVNGGTNSPLFVNNEGMCVAVGPVDVVREWRPAGPLGAKRYTTLDVTWDKDEMRQFMSECSNCSRMCSAHPVGKMRLLVIGPDRQSYCKACYDSTFVPCYGGCGKTLRTRDRGILVEADQLSGVRGVTHEGYIAICAECRPRHTFVCAMCQHVHHLSDRVDYHLGNGGRQPKRIFICPDCDRGKVHVAVCPSCTRAYPIAQLVEEAGDGRKVFTCCPQCRYRAKRKAGEKEDVGGLLPLLSPPKTSDVDQLTRDAFQQLRTGDLPPRYTREMEKPVPYATVKKLKEYAEYIQAHDWRPNLARPYLAVTLAKTDLDTWPGDPQVLGPVFQRYLDALIGENLMIVTNVETTIIGAFAGNVLIYLADNRPAITDRLVAELAVRLHELVLVYPNIDPGDRLEIKLDYMQKNDALLDMQHTISYLAGRLSLGWPAIESLTADYEAQYITLKFAQEKEHVESQEA